jgi:putative phosphoribosyl transferase
MFFELQGPAFADRREAGRQLAQRLLGYHDQHPIVLGLPRGGIVVAYEVASALDAPLDLLIVRKLGAPHQPELGIGAVVDADHPQVILDDELVRRLGVTRQHIDAEVQRQVEEIRRRERAYRTPLPPLPPTSATTPAPPLDIRGRVLILVDDGIATGSTVRAALRALRARGPARIVLATPVAAPETLAILRSEADEVVALHAPTSFRAVGQFYADFAQTEDAEVIDLLQRARPASG